MFLLAFNVDTTNCTMRRREVALVQKCEQIRRRIYANREEARQDVFDYIEMFCNPKRRHSHADGISPVKFEQQYFNRREGVY